MIETDELHAELRHKNARLEQRIDELVEQLVKVRGELSQSIGRAATLETIDPDSGLLHWRIFEERVLVEIARASRHQREIGLALLALAPASVGSLKDLALLARGQHRPFDLLGRTERDEVAILLPETSLHGALVVSERIRAVAAQHGHVVHAGYASWPRHGRVLGSVLHAARRALLTPPVDARVRGD